MKALLLWTVLCCSVIARGNGIIELECRLLAKEMPVLTDQSALTVKGRLIAFSALILAQNKSNASIQLPTANADIDVVAEADVIAVVLNWQMRNSWRGTPLVLPRGQLGIVELRPGESVLIVADADMPAPELPKLAHAVLNISPSFAERYGVYGGTLRGILRAPSTK